MQQRAFHHDLALLGAQPELVAQPRRVRRHPLHVPAASRVFVLQRVIEREDDVLARVELLAQVANARE